MDRHTIYAMPFAKVYPAYIKKAERKGYSKQEVDRIIFWLTGYDEKGLQQVLDEGKDLEAFFADAPRMHPNTGKIRGVVCGIRVEEIKDSLMQQIRWLDKLIDELARGKKMESILRS